MSYHIKIEPEAYQDIQAGIDWYDSQQVGLGRKFYAEVSSSFESLRKNPFYQVRYDNVRCLPVNRYPYMIHFTLDEKENTIIVRAVLSTYQNPDIWKDRSK